MGNGQVVVSRRAFWNANKSLEHGKGLLSRREIKHCSTVIGSKPMPLNDRDMSNPSRMEQLLLVNDSDNDLAFDHKISFIPGA